MLTVCSIESDSPLMIYDRVSGNDYKMLHQSPYYEDVGDFIYKYDHAYRLVKKRSRKKKKIMRYELMKACNHPHAIIADIHTSTLISQLKNTLSEVHYVDVYRPFFVAFLDMKRMYVTIRSLFLIVRDEGTILHVKDKIGNQFSFHFPQHLRNECIVRELILFVPSSMDLIADKNISY